MDDKYGKMRIKAIDYFMRGMTKADALIKAGYSESVAKTDAKSVFGREDVKEEIARRQVNLAKKANVDANWIVERLASIANADLGDLLVFDEAGRASIDMSLMGKDMRRALNGEFSGDGNPKNLKLGVKMSDKLRALEMLGRYLNLFDDKLQVEGEVNLVQRLHAGRARASGASSPVDDDTTDRERVG